MNIIVLIKEVPDMDNVRFDRERGVVDRSSARTEINPFDLNALQAAVDLKEKVGGEITAIVMGPPGAENSLRDAYARGADKGILLTDKKFGGSDTLATSKTLAAAIRKVENYDLIFCGEKSVDGDTAQVGAEVAELLDIPHAYYVEKINSLTENTIDVIIENLGGYKQERKMKLPALVSVTKNIACPKLPTLKRKLQSLKIDITKNTMADIGEYISEEEVGFKGSPTKVSKIEVPKETHRESKIYRDNYSCFIKDVAGILKSKNIIG